MSTVLRDFRANQPFVFDALMEAGARVAKRAAPSDPAYARGRGISRSRGAHQRAGRGPNPSTYVLAEFRAMAASTELSALPLLTESWRVVMSIEIEQLSNDEIRERTIDRTRREHHAEARETARTTELGERPSADQLDEAADADEEEALLQLERGALRREQARRIRRGEWD